MEVKCALQGSSTLGESIIWSPHEQALYWVDILGKKLHYYEPQNHTHQIWDMPDIVTSVSLRKKGGLILTFRKKIVFFDPKTQTITPFLEVERELTDNRFNNACCDTFGAFWGGTINDKNFTTPSGNLYRLDAKGNLSITEREGICFNGVGWSPDNKTMYVTQSLRYTIFAYDFEGISGTLNRKRVFVEADKNLKALPDGLAVDVEGYVWSAHNVMGYDKLGSIIRYSPSGEMDLIISIPVPQVTTCTFGGKDLNILYITTSREDMAPELLEKYPLSGSLFSIDTKVRGLPTNSYLG